MKKVLVVGSNGMLGQSLVKTFKEKYHVCGLSIESENFDPKNPPDEYYSVDLTKRNEIRHFFSKYTPEIIINAAAYTDVDKSEKDKEICWALNVKSIENMLEACESYSPLFVQISTDYIFSGDNGPYRETDIPNPIGYYGQSKLAGEKIVRSGNIEYIIARTMVLYGTGKKIRPNFVTWVIDQLKSGKKIRVVNDQLGNPTLNDDLSEAVKKLIENEEYGIFNIAGNEICSRYEFAKTIARVFNLDESLIEEITTTDLKQEAPRPMNSSFILDKLYNAIDWLPSNTEEGLKKLKSQMDL